jgi:ankyrin repeat protein
LLTRNPDLTFRAYLGATALHWAYFSGSRAVVEMLEQYGADAASRDEALGCMPRAFGICVPANWGFTAMVRAQLAADPTLVNVMDGVTSPLHEAARNDRTEVARLLLEHGANVSLADGEGKTPHQLAMEMGHVSVAELLRGAGAA